MRSPATLKRRKSEPVLIQRNYSPAPKFPGQCPRNSSGKAGFTTTVGGIAKRERALKADPNHLLTWQYYGLWQIEQGNRDSAQYHLSRIAAICGTACAEYRSLAAALEKAPSAGLVY
jgi:hypothetical protein